MQFSHTTVIVVVLIVSSPDSVVRATEQEPAETETRDPVSITLIQMDLKNAELVLRAHDLDDDGSLNETEWKRLNWTADEIRRFDLNRDNQFHHLEIALKLADGRIDDGIVQMDSILAERYMKQYDANRDNRLAMSELSQNSFTDAPESYDKNSDDELTQTELIRGLAFERKFRDELGIKGCDQGGAMKLINRGDQNGDRQIGDQELAQAGLSSQAMKFDRNGNERLSVSELAECLAERRNRLGLNPSDQIAARGLLRQMDRDGSGTIEAGEIPPGNPGAFLMNCDQNKDGDITELELERSFGDRRRALGYDDQDFERASTLIQRNDSDRSKSLSKSELVASGADRNSPLSPEKLTTIDKDSDQRISVDELAKYLKKTR